MMMRADPSRLQSVLGALELAELKSQRGLQASIAQRDEMAAQVAQLQSYRSEYQLPDGYPVRVRDGATFLRRLDTSVQTLDSRLQRLEREVAQRRQWCQQATARLSAMRMLITRLQDAQRSRDAARENRQLDELAVLAVFRVND